MSHSYCSGNLSSRSLGGALRYPGSSCGSFYPGHVVYSPGTCPQGSPVYGGCQETCYEPSGCQTSCYGPRTSTVCSPCQSNYPGSLGCGNAGLAPFGYGSSRAQSLGCGPGFSRPTYLSSRSYQSSCFQPASSSRCFGQNY
ncbi:PREDICTED: keratin-associated protein 13-1-like [Miniopterus natalensis]|uniref:keratin-associated protein 13-1-like n=1 Tax=Miniopterus natalensis TaxID=291302 RepID=UPI0007A6F2D8|nr:PREDICTED: keratin-associated protein 13-1-like [Miniopterus natalensis]